MKDFRKRKLLWALCAVACLAAAAAWSVRLAGSSPRAQAERLLRDQRLAVVRFTFQERYNGCRGPEGPICLGGAKQAELSQVRLRLAATAEASSGLLDRAARARTLHALAVVSLALQPGEAQTAVRLLERAVRMDPGDIRIATDLAAAQLLLGLSEDDIGSRLAALEGMDRLLDSERESSATRFNRALALESLGLRSAATSAWGDVQADDPEEGWRAEAKQRREHLGSEDRRRRWSEVRNCLDGEGSCSGGELAEAARAFPQQVRLYVEDVLFPRWGAAAEKEERGEASRVLGMARLLVEPLLAVGNGRLLGEALVHLEASTSTVELARAFRLYGEGRREHERQDYGKAARLFDASRILLERAGSPFAVWPRFYLAVGIHYGDPPDFDAAEAVYTDLDATVGASDGVIHGYSCWMLGYTAMFRGHWDKAMELYSDARSSFLASGEVENATAMESLLAELWMELGNRAEAWHWHGSALESLHRLHKSRRIQNVLTAVSALLQEEGRPGLAQYFSQAWIEEAERSRRPLSLALSRADRAVILSRLGRRNEAATELEVALAAVERIPQGGIRALTRSEVLLVAADVAVDAADFAAALRSLDLVLSYVDTSESRRVTVEALRRRAAVRMRRGDELSALADLRRAAAEIERQRSLLGDATQRIRYLDRARRVLEQWVRTLVDTGQWEEAFWVADALRAPEIRQALAERSVGDPSGASQRPRLLPEVTVLAFLSLPEELLIWTWDTEELRGRRLPRGRSALAAEVAAVRREIEVLGSPGPRAARLGRTLLVDLDDEARSVVIVPDGPLHNLVFAGLGDSVGDPLLARRDLVVTPSLEVSRRIEQGSEQRRVPASTLLVRGVEFSAEHFPALQRLEVGEQNDLAPLVGAATVLEGTEATPEGLLAELPRHAAVIFAGHSVSSTATWRQSGLVLSPEAPGDTGFLSAERLWQVGQLPTRLVFLASCSGADGKPSLSEGPLSLVRPLLAVGVRTVVASVAPVEGRATDAFLLDFLRAGDADPVAALREAQEAAYRRGDATTALAFQVYGSTEGRIVWK